MSNDFEWSKTRKKQKTGLVVPASELLISVTKPVVMTAAEPSIVVVSLSKVLSELGYTPKDRTHLLEDYAPWPYLPVYIEYEPGRFCAYSLHQPGWREMHGTPANSFERPYTYLGHKVYSCLTSERIKCEAHQFANFLYYTVSQIGGKRGVADCM